MTQVSVVIPTLNEETTIAICISKIQQVFADEHIDGEIILSDSSDDRTPEIGRTMGATIVHPAKRGYGNAYLEGFQHATGDVIIIGDADDTYDFSDIPKLLGPIQNGAEMVMGSRLQGEIRPGAMTPLHRYIGNPALTWMLNHLFHLHITDTHSGFRAIRREALARLDLKTGGMEFASEMIIEAARKGLVIEEVPIIYYPRQTPSKLHSFADGWRHVRFMLLYRPLPFIALPGLLFALLGLAMMVLFSLEGNVEEANLHSFILAAFLIVGGIQFLLTGISIKIYSITHGYAEKSGIGASIMNYHNLEKELFAGAIITALGLIAGIWIVWTWAASGFGTLSQIIPAIWSMVALVCGIQVIFSSIFISMMLLEEDE